MSRFFARVRTVSRDRGATLVELMISMSVLAVVLAAVFVVLISVQRAFTTQVDRSVNATQVGVVMQQLEKEIQSAEAFSICSNASCSTTLSTGSSCTTPTTSCYLIVYTQTNASTRQAASSPSAPFSCVEWRVAQVGSSPVQYAFQSRRWQPDWQGNLASLVGGWRYVSIAMAKVQGTFTVPSTASFGGRLLQVTVAVNNQPSTRSGTTDLSITRQLTGSNMLGTSTTSGSPNPCVPPNGTVPA
jgi:prepilin-type N-terminal cleavage/methylation domain-containing protein